MTTGRRHLHKKVYEKILKEIYLEFEKEWKETEQDPPPIDATNPYAVELEVYMRASPKSGGFISKELNNNFSTKNFVFERLKWVDKSFDLKKVHCYLLYAGYDNIMHFLQKYEYFQSEEGEKVKQEQEILLTQKGISKEKKEVVYNYYAFHLASENLHRYKLKIEFDSTISKRNFRGKATLYNDEFLYEGSITLIGAHLQILFPRENKMKGEWEPYFMLFHVQKKAKFESIPVLIGTYSTTSVISENTMAGEGILCREESVEQFEEAILRRLYINQNEIKINFPPSTQARGGFGVKKMLQTKNIERGLMKSLTGNYEAFGIFNDYKGLYRFNLEIDASCWSRVSTEDYSYWGVIEKAESTIIISNWREREYKNRIEGISRLDHSLVIKTTPTHIFRDTGNYLYRASFSAFSQAKDNISHDVFLLKVKDEIKLPKSYGSEDVADFLNERKEYKEVLQRLIRVDEEQMEVVTPYKTILQEILKSSLK